MYFSSPPVDPVDISRGDGSQGEATAGRKVLLFDSLIPLLVPGCQCDGIRVVKRARVSLAFPRKTVLQRRDHRRELGALERLAEVPDRGS
mmetsp:Transcript_17819/g.58608  ORF Transcript_17819/g.58608 Transcript_17819/m.58608 type:complete len:90 (+) Transcript_17819:107-376(+)